MTLYTNETNLAFKEKKNLNGLKTSPSDNEINYTQNFNYHLHVHVLHSIFRLCPEVDFQCLRSNIESFQQIKKLFTTLYNKRYLRNTS